MWRLAKYRIPLLVTLGIFTWIPIVIINFYYWITYLKTHQAIFPPGLSPSLRKSLFAAFFLVNYLLVDQLVKQVKKWDVIDLLWKLVVTGTAAMATTLLAEMVESLFEDDRYYPFFKTLGASVRLYVFLFFVLAALFVFRRLLLYQKTKRKLFAWNAFQGLSWLGLIRLFMKDEWPLTGYYQMVLVPLFLGLALFLATNVNWSAYLSFNQKLKSLFLLLLILICFGGFSYYFPYDALPDVGDPLAISFRSFQLPGIFSGEFMVVGLIFVFPFLYTLFSELVLLFNLPTSSVFEQRSSELQTLRRINQSIHSHQDVDQLFHTLLDSSLLSSNATGGWIERWRPENGTQSGKFEIVDFKNVQLDEIGRLKEREDIGAEAVANKRYIHAANLRKMKAFRFTRSRFRSLLVLPILQKDQPVGILYLVNELSGSFEEETIASMVEFSEQAGFALENVELMEQSLDFERYREQVKIAKEVQAQILPKVLPNHGAIRFIALSQDAEEIGGDFYDVVQNGTQYKVALGDVSGKGIEAAFYMAETKGIFQALANQELSVRETILGANRAISRCFNPGAFMTLTYLHLDLEAQQAELLRAGHCPTLHFDSKADRLALLENGVPGLGILRDARYDKLVGDPDSISFLPGDLLILFTDGIIEARNAQKEEFGIGRLQKIVQDLRHQDASLIAHSLIAAVKRFTGGAIHDDYTLLVIQRPSISNPSLPNP